MKPSSRRNANYFPRGKDFFTIAAVFVQGPLAKTSLRGANVTQSVSQESHAVNLAIVTKSERTLDCYTNTLSPSNP